MRKWLNRFVAPAVSAAFLFLSPAGATAEETEIRGIPVAATVRMTGAPAFDPASLVVAPGDTVAWRNESGALQTVTADYSLADSTGSVRLPRGTKPIRSGPIEPGGVFMYTFTDPGRYRYFSAPHEAEGMIGEVNVIPSGQCPVSER